MKFIRKNGRIIPIHEQGEAHPARRKGEHPENTKVINSLAKDHGISPSKVRTVAWSRGMNLRHKLDADQKGELSFKVDQTHGLGHQDLRDLKAAGDRVEKRHARNQIIAGATVAAVGGHIAGTSVKAALEQKKIAAESFVAAKLAVTRPGKKIAAQFTEASATQVAKALVHEGKRAKQAAKFTLKAGGRALQLGNVLGAGLVAKGTNTLLSKTELKNHPKTKAAVSAGAAATAAIVSEIAFRKAVGGKFNVRRLVADAALRSFRKLGK